jgi:DNA-directed RNA polymerase specialized sigma24 family protein
MTSSTSTPAALRACEAPAADTAWTVEFNAHILQLALARAQERFEPPTWRAFELVWLNNTSAADVATQMGQPIDWVYVAKSRVLKQIWEEVQNLTEDTSISLHAFR